MDDSGELGYPVEILIGPGRVGSYRLVEEGQSAAFWEDYNNKKRNWISPHEANELREKISELTERIAVLEKDKEFYVNYVNTQDEEIKSLKRRLSD